MQTFRFNRSIPVGYNTQGYIYFLLRRYRELEKAEQKQLQEICWKVAGAYAPAVLEYVTEDTDVDYICSKYHLSPSTLERMKKKVYVAVADKL